VKHVGTIIGTAIAGMFVMSVWGSFVGDMGSSGIIAGWFAALIIIGSMWVLNHYVGIHNNDGAWVDMALGIGVAGFTRGIFESGIQVGMDSLPTLGLTLLGGAIGGFAAWALEQEMAKKQATEEKKAA